MIEPSLPERVVNKLLNFRPTICRRGDEPPLAYMVEHFYWKMPKEEREEGTRLYLEAIKRHVTLLDEATEIARLREALKQAQEALEVVMAGGTRHKASAALKKAKTTLKETE